MTIETRSRKVITLPQPTGALPEPANTTIFWVETMTLKGAPWNPAGRTTRAAVRDLMIRIEEEGFEPFRPILVSKDGFIGDGHRRWTAAQFLGMPRVPVIFTEKSIQDLWAGNKGARPIRANEWMAVWVTAGITDVPGSTKKQIKCLTEILGAEGMQYLVERGQSPSIWRIVWRVGQYCKNTKAPFLRKTTYWLIKHKMHHRVDRGMWQTSDAPINPKLLAQAIEHDLPLKQEWTI